MQRNKISFKGQKIFIGINVHAKSWKVAIAPEVGAVKGHSQKPSAKELFDFLKKNYPDGEYQALVVFVTEFFAVYCDEESKTVPPIPVFPRGEKIATSSWLQKLPHETRCAARRCHVKIIPFPPQKK